MELEDMTDQELALKIYRLKERLKNDKICHPLNWRFIGQADKESLERHEAERKRRRDDGWTA